MCAKGLDASPDKMLNLDSSASVLTREEMLDAFDRTSFSSRSRLLIASAAVGALTGAVVTFFKTCIVLTATAVYGADFTHGWIGTSKRLGWSAVVFPSLGGLLVAALRTVTPGGRFGPGLAGHVAEVEGGRTLRIAPFVSRSAAAVVTLGTGNSLGPEGPSVEIGCGVSRLVGAAASASGGWRGADHLRRRQRQLLAGGAAAGVASGFNAPLSGIFFALEVVAAAVRASVPTSTNTSSSLVSEADTAELDVKSRTAILGVVLSALVSAVVAQELQGGTVHGLAPARWPSRLRLVVMPLYVGLGAVAGCVAFLFKRLELEVRALFAESGADGSGGGRLRGVPTWSRPALGGLVCGLVGIVFPQVLFFGYSTLDAILTSGVVAGSSAAGSAVAGSVAPSDVTEVLRSALKGSFGGAAGAALLPWPGLGVLGAKLLTTSVCVACGLVGGTFAPSLLLGASLGVVYQAVAARTLAAVSSALPWYGCQLAVAMNAVSNVPAFAMVGGAAFLSSVFRAPLTATLLLFELTRGYELILPLLCAAGVGPIVYDAVERRFLQGQQPFAGDPIIKEGSDTIVPPECDVDNKMVCP